VIRLALIFLIALFLLLNPLTEPFGLPHWPANAAEQGEGADSKLPIPRFVSLKADKVNVRKGPSTDQAIVWVFSRAGLPVEITAESDNWRQVRDSEGDSGWVFHSLLSGRRTVLISPWVKDKKAVPLYESASTGASVVADLQPNVLGNVISCDGKWCHISVGDYSGYVQQVLLWGAYKGEVIN
jgi:SH3-like domain-containing protein